MSNKEISKEKIERLMNLKDRYVAEHTNFLTTIFIATTGFCLATLSATTIPHSVNFGLTVLTLLIFLLTLLRIKSKASPLYKFQTELREEYSKCEKSLLFIDEHDPWKGFQRQKVVLWISILVSVLFVIYTAIAHFIGMVS